MVDGNRLGDVGFKYLGIPYSQMDCQKFVERCLADCGFKLDLTGSNAWYRYIMEHGVILTPEECVKQFGCVPKGAILFIHAFDGKEPEKYRNDGKGNASHMGIVTNETAEQMMAEILATIEDAKKRKEFIEKVSHGNGAIHSSSSRECVCTSAFKGKTINGGWNKVGLPDFVVYDYGDGGAAPPTWRPTIRKGSKGTEVAYVQSILADLGYDLGSAGIDGDFGRKTEEAVKDFQRDHGLNPDGVVGPLTYDALENATPVVKDYTVIIPNLTKDEADAIKEAYPNATITVG